MDNFKAVKSSVNIVRKSGAKVWKTICQKKKLNPRVRLREDKVRCFSPTEFLNNPQEFREKLTIHQKNECSHDDDDAINDSEIEVRNTGDEFIMKFLNTSSVQKTQKPLDNEIHDNIIQKKIIVCLNQASRRGSPLRTPICKSPQAGCSVSNKKSTSWINFQSDSTMSPISCGSNEQLDVSFSSSHGSDDSISELLSDYEDLDEPTLDESDAHFEIFVFLRKKCNEHLNNMKEVSKKLKVFRNRKENKIVDELLQTERELLFSSESYVNCLLNMTNCNYTLEESPSVDNATITISTIKIPLQDRYSSDSESYFICIARSDKTVHATKYMKPQESDGQFYLLFEEVLVFEKLEKSFRIDLNIYELTTSDKKNIFRKETVDFSPVKHYASPTSRGKEKHVPLHSAFKQCGRFEISLKNIQTNTIFNSFPSLSLSRSADITRLISNLFINSNREGFLNFGQQDSRGESIIWNLKYILFEESEIKIFNSRSDLSKEPLAKIDLKNLSSEITTHSCYLKYCFQVNVVCKEVDLRFPFMYSYFFRAKTRSDFENWLENLNGAINVLKRWNMLEYID